MIGSLNRRDDQVAEDESFKTVQLETLRLQYETIEQRLARHESRLWQLPAFYWALIAFFGSVLKATSSPYSMGAAASLFAGGMVLAICWWLCKEAYVRDLRKLLEIESRLNIDLAIQRARLPVYPFLIMIGVGLICSTFIGVE